MYTSDVTPAGVRAQVEQAIQALAPCLRTMVLDHESRRHLLLTVDLLTSVWSDLQRDTSLLASKASALRTLLALCEMAAACEYDEMPLALRAVYRMVENWQLPQETVALSPEPSQGAAAEAVSPEQTEEVAEQTAEAVPLEEEIQPTEAAPALTEIAQAVVETVASEPKGEPFAFAEARVDEARKRLSERLEALANQLDHVQNHSLPREEAVPLLMACACRYRLIHAEAVANGRRWDVGQIKRHLTALVKERFHNLWLAPMDMNVELSEHELESLQTGYDALAKSWQMWRWYQQHGSELDKGTGAPLLESIAAPVPMVQQIWTSKQLLSRLYEHDGAEALREAVREEAERRKWKLEMLASNSSRQRQLHYIKHADEHWDAARRQVEKKTQQQEAIDRLQAVLTAPNPDTFEEDLLCALVACHRAQIPYSNKQLCELVSGYHFLLENPAVPEQCGLSKSEGSAARKFLVNLGKQLLKNEQKEVHQEQQPEEETSPEHNGDLLRKAREITQGKKLFLLCFNRRAEAEQNIRDALQFAEVDWPDLDGAESVNRMEAHIRNADMTVVVVRYSRTHWKEARDIARQYGKQFVMATKGYGVTHLAQQIVEQCGR